jgi:hypothetical protein
MGHRTNLDVEEYRKISFPYRDGTLAILPTAHHYTDGTALAPSSV